MTTFFAHLSTPQQTHREECTACMKKYEMMRLTVEVFVWPLPGREYPFEEDCVVAPEVNKHCARATGVGNSEATTVHKIYLPFFSFPSCVG